MSIADWRHRPTLSMHEVARLTGLGVRDVAALVAQRKLETITVHGHVLVRVASVRAVFEAPTVQGDHAVATTDLVNRVRAAAGDR